MLLKDSVSVNKRCRLFQAAVIAVTILALAVYLQCQQLAAAPAEPPFTEEQIERLQNEIDKLREQVKQQREVRQGGDILLIIRMPAADGVTPQLPAKPPATKKQGKRQPVIPDVGAMMPLVPPDLVIPQVQLGGGRPIGLRLQESLGGAEGTTTTVTRGKGHFKATHHDGTLNITIQGIIAEDSANTRTVLYKARINLDQAEVRCKPSTSPEIYSTSKLRQGETVEVVEELEGGWLAIKPPPDSYSWINRKLVRKVGDEKGSQWVVESLRGATVLIGSTLKVDRPTVEGPKLERGIQVTARGPILTDETGQWLPILPPLTEVRYVLKDHVVKENNPGSVGKATVTTIHIRDGVESHRYKTVDEVPEKYRDAVRRLIEMNEKVPIGLKGKGAAEPKKERSDKTKLPSGSPDTEIARLKRLIKVEQKPEKQSERHAERAYYN